jgi:hypothetical protein
MVTICNVVIVVVDEILTFPSAGLGANTNVVTSTSFIPRVVVVKVTGPTTSLMLSLPPQSVWI